MHSQDYSTLHYSSVRRFGNEDSECATFFEVKSNYTLV